MKIGEDPTAIVCATVGQEKPPTSDGILPDEDEGPRMSEEDSTIDKEKCCDAKEPDTPKESIKRRKIGSDINTRKVPSKRDFGSESKDTEDEVIHALSAAHSQIVVTLGESHMVI